MLLAIRFFSFVFDTFLTGPRSIQPTNDPTVFTFLSHAAAYLPHAVSRLPDDDAVACLLDAADRLIPSRPRPPTSVLVLPSLLHPLTLLPCFYGSKVDLSGHLHGVKSGSEVRPP
jgi:hypothetical protein